MEDRTSPFDSLEETFERLNRRLETAARSWESEIDSRSRLDLSMGRTSTKLDLADEGDAFVATVDVPGYGSDDLEIRIRGETLAISGERERDHATADDRADRPGTYVRREREAQSFSRQVRLPGPVDADGVTATVTNGILTVRLPKREPPGETHTIDIE